MDGNKGIVLVLVIGLVLFDLRCSVLVLILIQLELSGTPSSVKVAIYRSVVSTLIKVAKTSGYVFIYSYLLINESIKYMNKEAILRAISCFDVYLDQQIEYKKKENDISRVLMLIKSDLMDGLVKLKTLDELEQLIDKYAAEEDNDEESTY